MQNDTSIMKFEKTLPPDFDGVFRFTNPSKEDFIGKWGGKEYLFPAETTTPLIIVEHSPLEIQHIRKKFARDLAEREYYKSKEYNHQLSREGARTKNGMWNPSGYGMSHAGAYTISDLEPYIKKCLIPLKAAEIMSRPQTKRTVEEKLTHLDDGRLMTEAVDGKASLRQKALNS